MGTEMGGCRNLEGELGDMYILVQLTGYRPGIDNLSPVQIGCNLDYLVHVDTLLNAPISDQLFPVKYCKILSM